MGGSSQAAANETHPKKKNNNDSRRYNNTPLSLHDELANSHNVDRPSTEDAKNRTNAKQPIRRRLNNDGHENVRRPNSNKV